MHSNHSTNVNKIVTKNKNVHFMVQFLIVQKEHQCSCAIKSFISNKS